jgi:tRNA(Ile)-lysidine synthase TilS/MesJ
MTEEEEKQQKHRVFKIHQKAWKCIKEYGLIEDGDRILIGLSGGKDSLALTEILGERMKIIKPRFTVVAAHISVTNIGYQSDLEYLSNYARQFGIKLVHATTSFDASTDNRKSPCFLCSWNRRKTLFEIAVAEGCNKIALGHHMDDILETLLMNMTFQGAVSTMPPKLKMNKFDMTIIRPLSLNSEKEMLELAAIRGFKKQQKNCPYEKDSHRSDMKGVLRKLEEMNPAARYSLWSSMNNVQTEYLPKKLKE